MRVLFLDLDTLRPDHLGCYGYHRNTSPNIDRIAAEGVRFDNYYCSDAPCLPSRAALVTGRFGIHNGAVGHGGTAADLALDGPARRFRSRLDSESLFKIFRRQGAHTCCISPFAERHSAFWFDCGFNEIHNTGQGGMESAEQVTPTALQWIAANAVRDNWYLHLNYWDAHTPYRAPADFGNPFADQPLPTWLTEEVLAEHRRHVGPHSAREISMWDSKANPKFPRHPGELKNMADVRQMIDGYDCGIGYLDDHLGRLFRAFEQAGVMDDLAIVISADHGENQGELGIYGEHATADQATCRIPMIIRWPGCRRGAVDAGLHHNLDLAPTLAELFGAPACPRWDGASFAGALRDGGDCGKEYAVISQCAHVCQRAVRFGPWLYIRTYHDGGHLFPKEMLFNVVDDPHEQVELAGAHPHLCLQGNHYLSDWHDRMMASMAPECTQDPLWRVIGEGGPEHARGQLPAYVRRLAETDRGWAVEEVKRRHPEQF